jgi:hypothetical protein
MQSLYATTQIRHTRFHSGICIFYPKSEPAIVYNFSAGNE